MRILSIALPHTDWQNCIQPLKEHKGASLAQSVTTGPQTRLPQRWIGKYPNKIWHHKKFRNCLFQATINSDKSGRDHKMFSCFLFDVFLQRTHIWQVSYPNDFFYHWSINLIPVSFVNHFQRYWYYFFCSYILEWPMIKAFISWLLLLFYSVKEKHLKTSYII